jgi:hypothetical protein
LLALKYYWRPSTTACPQLLLALQYWLASTTGRPRLLSAPNYWLPSTVVCPQLLGPQLLEEHLRHGRNVRQGHPRGVHARQHGRPRNAAGVNARQHACPSAQRNMPQRTPSRPPRLDIPDPHATSCPDQDPTRDHITQNHYIQDGRRNARCAALSTWGEAHSRQWQLHG